MLKNKPFLLASLFLLMILLYPSGLQAEHTEEFTKVFPLKATGSFSLKNVNGPVTITTWNEEKVEVKAIKTTKARKENLEKVKIEVEATPDSVSVNTIYPKLRNTRVNVSYEVKVPEGVHLPKVSSVNGAVRISGPFGEVSASTVNGQVHLNHASGTITLSATNGNIEASDVKGRLEASTVNGSISLEMISLDKGIKAKTVNGAITLSLGSEDKLNAFLTAKTVNGGISLDVPITFQNFKKTRRTLEGQIGTGGPDIYLQTVNGPIRIRR